MAKLTESKHLQADPVDVPSMTSELLDCLKALAQYNVSPEALHEECSRLGASFDRLRTELRKSIMDQLQLTSDTPLECSRTIAAAHWKQALLDGILSWLWDIDASEI